MSNEILETLKAQSIKDIDLTQFDFKANPVDFSGRRLESADFSGNDTLHDIKFRNAVLIDCLFERSQLENCDFSGAKISGTGAAKYSSFKDAKIYKTKFRDASLDVCDFRYADLTDCTLQGAYFKYTDFYRSAFKGITVFLDTKIESCSLNYISFETFCLTRDNLKANAAGAVLVQENEAVFRDFLAKWVRLDNVKNQMDVVENGLAAKFLEAERIYRQLSALWEEKGHNRDADWAYVQGKRMERKRLWTESGGNVFINRTKAAGSYLADVTLGYGVSLSRSFITYIVLIFLFGFIYKGLLPHGIADCMKLSMAYAIGAGGDSPAPIEGLSILQTGLGMMLTGFMGFVVANKIRKS